MSSTAIATQQAALSSLSDADVAAIMERVLIVGDLAKLTTQERVNYVLAVCKSVGLNPLTQPLMYILDRKGKLALYVKRDGTDQLRKLHSVSITVVGREVTNGAYVVTARAALPEGRCDESIGAVWLGNLKGEDVCNAVMKAETKAKRRVTLSICGLGFLDESEAESIGGTMIAPGDPLPALGAGELAPGEIPIGEPSKVITEPVNDVQPEPPPKPKPEPKAKPAKAAKPEKVDGAPDKRSLRLEALVDSLKGRVREVRDRGVEDVDIRSVLREKTGAAGIEELKTSIEKLEVAVKTLDAWIAELDGPDDDPFKD